MILYELFDRDGGKSGYRILHDGQVITQPYAPYVTGEQAMTATQAAAIAQLCIARMQQVLDRLTLQRLAGPTAEQQAQLATLQTVTEPTAAEIAALLEGTVPAN